MIQIVYYMLCKDDETDQYLEREQSKTERNDEQKIKPYLFVG